MLDGHFRPQYEVKLIHRYHDWNASITWPAKNAKDARRFVLRAFAAPENWMIVSAKRVKKG